MGSDTAVRSLLPAAVGTTAVAAFTDEVIAAGNARLVVPVAGGVPVSIAELALEPERFCLDEAGVLIAPGVAYVLRSAGVVEALPPGVLGAVDWIPSTTALRSDVSDWANAAALLALLPMLP